jgi:hypothetical protein
MTTVPVTTGPRPAPGALRMTPGRWVALLCGVPVALALIGWTGFSVVTWAGQASFPVNATFQVRDGHLAASVGSGDLNVHQGPAGSGVARLSGRVQYSLFRPRFSVSGNDIHLDCRLPTGNCGLSADLSVPPGTSVDLTSGGGNMQVGGIQGDATLDSGGGDVAVSRVTGAVTVSSGGGNVTAGDLGGVLDFSTGGGDVGGNTLYSSHVTLDTGGGNVTLVFTEVPSYISVSSGGGDITIVLPRSSTASYDIKNPQSEGGDYSASVPTNGASGNTISVDSGGGNISIAEAS